MPHKPFVNEKILAHRKVIGEKVRQLRADRKLTLKEAADLCGISVAHISELERGRISPTVNTMFKVANGFEKPISFFLPDEYLTMVQVVRRDEQETHISEKSAERILSDGIPGATLAGSHLTLERGGSFLTQANARSEVIGIILKGDVELTLNGESHRLREGDTLHVKERVPQMVKNVGRSKAEMMWISAIYHLFR